MVPLRPHSPPVAQKLTPGPQVLFKRKPVQFLTAPEIEDENQEVRSLPLSSFWSAVRAIAANTPTPQVWHIPQTGEVFPTYEDYLNRWVPPLPPALSSHLCASVTDISLGWTFINRYFDPPFTTHTSPLSSGLLIPFVEALHLHHQRPLRSDFFSSSQERGELLIYRAHDAQV